MEKKIIFSLALILLAGCLLAYSYLYDGFDSLPEQKESFELNPSLFKISINEGETISTSLNIKNIGPERNFYLETADLENIVLLEKNSIVIPAGETAQIKLQITGFGSSYGAYMGHISVSDGTEKKVIPFVVSLNTKNQFFAISLNAAPENKQLLKEDSLAVDVKFFNLYDSEQHNLEVYYRILNISGGTVFSDSENISIGSKTAFTKKIPLPEEIILGDYVFTTFIKYEDSITTSTYLFSVVDRRKFDFSLMDINILAGIVSFFVLITFILIAYMFYERNKLFRKLKKQNLYQLANSSKGISIEEEKYLAKAKTAKQRKKITAQFRDAKEKILNEMKRQQKEHVMELKSLRKSKKEKEEKINQWNEESYSKALEAAKIDENLKDKLEVLKKAYSEGFIKKESYSTGVSELESASKKLKRNIYK